MSETPKDERQNAPSFRPLSVRIPEACRITGIGRSKLYELIQPGDIAVIKIGAMTLVPIDSLEALLAANRSSSRAS